MSELIDTSLTHAKGVKWNLSDLYLNLDDLKIEEDIKNALSRAKLFEQKYRGKINSESITPLFLLQATKELESISEQIGKLLSYAYLIFASDTSNPKHGAFLQSIQEKSTEVRKHLMFFELEWIGLPDQIANLLLNDLTLSRYRH
ncbi:MAG TPA: oligoendopeptidase, partial [Thermodesulfobacteriota bacterium]